MDQNLLEQTHPAIESKWVTRGGLLLLCLLGLGLRLRLALALPLWLDEALTWRDCQLPLHDLLLWRIEQLPGPLYDLLARISIAGLGPTELALRLPSIGCGIASIVVGFWLVARISDAFTALLFAAFLAVDPVLVRCDADARMYSLWLLIVLGSFHVIVGILQPLETLPSSFRLRMGEWALLGLLLALCFWTHPLATYFWAAVGAAFLLIALRQQPGVRGPALRVVLMGLTIAYATAIALSAPGLTKMVAIAWQRRNSAPSNNDLILLFQTFASSRWAAAYYLAAAVGLWLFYRRKPNIDLHFIVLIACAVLAIVVGRHIHHLNERYLYPTVPPFYFGVAFLISSLVRRVASLFSRVGLAVACIVLAAFFAYRTSQTVRNSESTLRSPAGVYAAAHLIQYVAAHQDPDDLSILLTPMLEPRADYYGLRGTRLSRNGDWWDRENVAFGYDLQALRTNRSSHVWLIIEPVWQKDTYAAQRELVAACGPLVRTAPFTDEEITAVLNEGVVRISPGRVEGASCAEVFKDRDAPLRPLLE